MSQVKNHIFFIAKYREQKFSAFREKKSENMVFIGYLFDITATFWLTTFALNCIIDAGCQFVSAITYKSLSVAFGEGFVGKK